MKGIIWFRFRKNNLDFKNWRCKVFPGITFTDNHGTITWCHDVLMQSIRNGNEKYIHMVLQDCNGNDFFKANKNFNDSDESLNAIRANIIKHSIKRFQFPTQTAQEFFHDNDFDEENTLNAFRQCALKFENEGVKYDITHSEKEFKKRVIKFVIEKPLYKPELYEDCNTIHSIVNNARMPHNAEENLLKNLINVDLLKRIGILESTEFTETIKITKQITSRFLKNITK